MHLFKNQKNGLSKMNKLVEEIIKPILEANSKITKVIGIK